MGMRWRFAEDTDPNETRSRMAIREAIDRWWELFAKNADAVDSYFRRGREFDLSALMENLSAVDPKMMWEFGPAVQKSGHRLCITPESRAELRPFLQVILDRAPDLPSWEFYPYRLADHIDGDPVVKDGRTNVSMEGATVSIAKGSHNRIDLSYFIRGTVAKEEAAKAAFYCTERLVGEEILDQWIGRIEGKSGPTPDLTDPHPVSLTRLRPTVESLIDSICSHLPTVPRYRVASQPRGEPQQHSLLKLNLPPRSGDCPRWLDQYLAVTPEVGLFNATRSNHFYSKRFSRLDETFCYLKIGEVMNTTHRGEIEDEISSTLGEKGLVCTWGAGTGKLYSYIELALVEVEPSIPFLRDILRRAEAHERTWLLFHDATLRDEWIGIYSQTPPPPV